MKLYDIGCFNGDSPLHFIADPLIDEIQAYDPNPRFRDIWSAIETHYPSIKFTCAAVSNRNGKANYSLMPEHRPLGSTISQDKRDYGVAEITEVKCLDIADIITHDCWVKLDAEGGEYDIIERLIETDKLRFIKKIWLEWHTGKMKRDYSDRQRKIEEELKRLEIEVLPW